MSFEQILYASGLLPRDIIPDGKWRRCATADKPTKRNGAYALHPDGRGYWQNWATDLSVNAWHDATKARAPVNIHEIAIRRAAERDARVKAIKAARTFWAAAAPMLTLHPYLAKKGLTAEGCAGLRVKDDLLVVPVFWNGALVSVQTIAPDGQKRFWPGAPVKAGSVELHRKNAALTAFCEGLATGLAVYQAVKSARVFVAFNAGNLGPVVNLCKPTGSVVICADNDHGTEGRRGVNPGLDKARAAAETIGAGVAYPEGIEGTDWADALAEIGAGAARKIERHILAKAVYVFA